MTPEAWQAIVDKGWNEIVERGRKAQMALTGDEGGNIKIGLLKKQLEANAQCARVILNQRERYEAGEVSADTAMEAILAEAQAIIGEQSA